MTEDVGEGREGERWKGRGERWRRWGSGEGDEVRGSKKMGMEGKRRRDAEGMGKGRGKETEEMARIGSEKGAGMGRKRRQG